MSISDLMRTPVETVQGSCTIADAARAMLKHSVGALVIADASRRPTGIVTDRDLVTMISEGLDPKQATRSIPWRGDRSSRPTLTTTSRASRSK